MCEKCSNSSIPGRVIAYRKGKENEFTCSYCGNNIVVEHSPRHGERWDKYFYEVCKSIASKSPCLSRQIGAILVKDKSIISTGYNGPARGYPHCKAVRVEMPDLKEMLPPEEGIHTELVCPRYAKGYKSGEGLDECPAAHAEVNCIANAARAGASTIGSTLYMNCIIPCKDCAVAIVNAGITEVVVEDIVPYDDMSIEIFKHGKVKVRRLKI